ncbi:jg19915 [Pararge aegeria aegeria]|uniref:Jg19915 protein n=1 Tax=Pararge aegeria aegeria TaxID=348720 RepID=A0A8S4S9K9_9NEOP|nr:jg19915 [Pararge aegeria aegeria]
MDVVFMRSDASASDSEMSGRNIDQKELVSSKSKQSLKTKIETVRVEYEKAKDSRNLKFSRLAKAVVEANVQENRATEKFLDNVESIMNRFPDLSSVERLYENVLKQLPK